MRTVYIVTYQNTPLFAFDSRVEAENYMQECIGGQLPGGQYLTRENFTYHQVSYLKDIREGK